MVPQRGGWGVFSGGMEVGVVVRRYGGWGCGVCVGAVHRSLVLDLVSGLADLGDRKMEL